MILEYQALYCADELFQCASEAAYCNGYDYNNIAVTTVCKKTCNLCTPYRRNKKTTIKKLRNINNKCLKQFCFKSVY